MGFFEKIFGRLRQPKGAYQGKMMLLNGAPAWFPAFGGDIYAEQRVRAAVDAVARHCSKLEIKFSGSAKPEMVNALKRRPNAVSTWSQFLYRVATIYMVENNVILIPLEDAQGNVTGIWPLLTSRSEIAVYGGIPWLRYRFANGEVGAVELDRVGFMRRYQYRDDLFGESNAALHPTMDLINVLNRGAKEAVKSSTGYKFMARIKNFVAEKNLKEMRQRFSEQNLRAEEGNDGVLTFPMNYEDIKQIEMKPYVADADTIKLINDGIDEYFGVNEKVLTNAATGDDWAAFYEGAIETFAIQLSEVMTDMLFTPREQAAKARVTATSNRLQYMSNADKLNVTTQLVDRGIMSLNDALAVWNLPPIDGGDVRVIRGEYVNLNDRSKQNAE